MAKVVGETLTLPDHLVLTVLPVNGLTAQSHNATVLIVTVQGIGWRDDIAHPDSVTFTPWHRVVSLDW